ncbi:MAG: hypothetical protein HND47_23585 [Chloroflexi bacterium]|nr:hypothetical protein [Chloroflexota bacterium]
MIDTHSPLKMIDLSRARSTVINWPVQVESIVDGYRGFRGISHGVQKDAIQNAWDARKDKKHANGWSITFELIKGKSGRRYFAITDQGTTGLTGRVLKPEELETDLPPEERWGRFENVAFTKGPSEEALGSRGRGKFIFVGASAHQAEIDKKLFKNLILYDTLREDGIYRFGYRTIVITDSPIDSYDGDEGKKMLRILTEGSIEPLNHVGSRVIIVDPIDELIDDMESGKFVEYICETWWEIIQKYNASIYVKTPTKSWKGKIPKEFVLPTEDSKEYKVWIQKDRPLPGAPKYRVKCLHIVRRNKGPIPEELRGVAVQRGGMKVCPIYIRYAPQDVTESVYGYIAFDKDLDNALRADENPEHYSFDFRRSLPKAVKQYVEDELTKFAREKLGLGVDPKKVQHQRQTNAEQRAMFAVNKIASKFGMLGKGEVVPPPPPPPPQPPRLLRLEMPLFKFPRDSHRVNYGETVSNILLTAYNDTEKKVQVGLKMYLFFEDVQLVKYIENEEIRLYSHSASKTFGPFKQHFTEEDFPGKGKYTIRAKMISLDKETKGDELHVLSRHFWLEQDPPEKGLFEKCEALDYPEEMIKIMGEAVRGESEGYLFQYNNIHPAKRAVDDEEDSLTEYLVKIMGLQLPWIDLRREKPVLFSKEDLESPENIAQKVSKIMGQILYEYYSM